MLVAIHQSHYLPWLGYLDKIDRSDLFVVLDDCQFEKNDWQNRNRILSPHGWQWISVPVSFRFGDRILDVALSEPDRWPRKHWRALQSVYGKCPHFDERAGEFEALYSRAYTKLVEVNAALLDVVLRAFGIKTRILISSELGVVDLASTDRLVALCQKLGADAYLYGGHGKDYMDMAALERAGILPVDQAFRHPTYPQRLAGREVTFIPGLSCLDLLFNCGPDSLSILRSERA